MKPYLLFIGILLTSFDGFSDEIPCATEVTREYSEKMKQTLPEFEAFKLSFQKNENPSGRIASGLMKNSIPVKIYIVRTDAGGTTLDTALLRKGFNFMNRVFAGSGLEFYICGPYNYINNTTYYSLDNTEYTSLNTTYGTANVINMYFVNGINHGGSSASGVAPTPGGGLWVMMRNNADTTVYPHEMGHFFGLLHTHGYSNTEMTQEFVDGSNCHEAGDYMCDTPADPRLSPAIVNGANVNSQCIYYGNLKDGHNQVFVPDATNIMSYGPARCLSHFSADQLAYMNWVYINRRLNLTCSSVNVNFNISNAMSCDSPYVFQFTKQTTGVTNLLWDVNDDGVTDYTTNNPSHSYTTPGIKWVSLSGTAAGVTYTRYKPIEIVVPNKVPKLNDFNSSTLLPDGWKLYNPDYARSWEIINAIGPDGQASNLLRYKNYNYIGYEEQDAVITNAYDLRNFKNARLTFDVAYAPHNKTDTLLIYASTDCGNSYPYLIQKLYGSSLQTHSKQFNEFIPTENDWKNVIVSLNTYVNNYVSFKIVNYNMGGNNLYIDNIRVEGGDSTLSEIGFARTLINTGESSSGGQTACRGYSIVSVPVFISSAPNSNITVNVTATGTASNLHDYELLTSQVVFLSGQTANKIVNVKVYNDAASEVTENIILSLVIQGNSIYKTTNRNRTAAISIIDNDPVNPEQKIFSAVLMDEKFENVSPTTYMPIGWTGNGNIFGTSSLFAIGNWFYDAYLVTRNNSLDSTHYMMFWGDAGYIHLPEDVIIESPIINISGYDSITIELDHWLQSWVPYTGDVVVEVWNGTAWINRYINPSLKGNIGGVYRPEHVNVSAVGYTNTDFKIRIGLLNEKSSYWYLFDNFKVTGFKTKAKIATTLNSAATAYLGPNQLVNFYDNTTGNIIASIQNQSSWNYGCTTVSINREGNGALPYLDNNPAYFATQKTLLITPEFNNPNGIYDISIYYKNAEVNGWVNTTNNPLTNLGIVKSGAAIANVTPSNPYANGATNYAASNVSNQPYLTSDYKISGRFTQGFSGFAGAYSSFNNLLPVELIKPLQAIYIKDIGNEISWTTAEEFNCDYFEVQRSQDAHNFISIATIKGQGNSNILHDYTCTDKNFNEGKNYYRFKQADFNGKYTYSNLAMVNNEESTKNTFELFPNPVKDILMILADNKTNPIIIRILNAFGQEVKVITLQNNQQNSIDVSTLCNGVYFVSINTDDKIITKSFVKQ